MGITTVLGGSGLLNVSAASYLMRAVTAIAEKC